MTTLKWGSQKPVNTTTLGDQDDASIATLANGDYIVVWSDDPVGTAVIRAQRFNADGSKDGAEFIAGSNAEEVFSPDVIALADGGYAVSWTVPTGVNKGLRIQEFNADGSEGAYTIINQPGGGNFFSSLAAHGSGYAVAYNSQVGTDQLVKLRIFDGNPGGPFPSEIIVSDATPGKVMGDVSVASLAGGNVAVAWYSGSAVHYRVYDADGTALTGDTKIAGNGLVGQIALVARGDGFMLDWVEDTIGAGEAKIRGQVFDAAGGKVGAEFNVSPATAETAISPELLTLADGRVFATWIEYSTYSLKGRLFDPATGTGEAPITIATGVKLVPAGDSTGLSLLGDGRIVVTWSTDAGEVASQILDPRDGHVTGGDGNDTLYGHDTVNDIVKGGGGADAIDGLGGNDFIEGGFDADTIHGGQGNDTIYAMTAAAPDGSLIGDIIFGDAGDDTLNGSKGDDKLSGGDGEDDLDGGASNDTLEGGLHFDTLHGGDGDDTLYAHIAANPSGSGIGDELHGDNGNDTLIGSNGADQLFGGADKDRLSGLGGPDTLDGGDGADTADYRDSAAAVTVKLGQNIATGGDAEGDTLISIENLTGSLFADTLNGDGFANLLNGSKGDDKINAGGAKDILIGGAGLDALVGGTEADRFDFTALTDSAVGAQRDKIGDFTVDPAAGSAFVDRINVSGIDAVAAVAGNQAFAFIGGSALSAEGQIRAYQVNAHTVVEFNTTGNGGAEMEIVLMNFIATTLSAADFIL